METPIDSHEFTVIPNFLIKSAELKPAVILLLMRMRQVTKDGVCQQTNEELAGFLGYSTRQVQRFSVDLKKAKFISVKVFPDEGNRREITFPWNWGVDRGDNSVVTPSNSEHIEGGGDKSVVRGSENMVIMNQNGELFSGGSDIRTKSISKEKVVKDKIKDKRNKEGVDWSIRFDGKKLTFSDTVKALDYYRRRFPRVNLEKNIFEMENWLRDNGPKSAYHSFITRWLTKDEAKEKFARPTASSKDFKKPEPKYKPVPKLNMDEILRKGIDEGPPGWKEEQERRERNGTA